jgi:hypothetical protein
MTISTIPLLSGSETWFCHERFNTTTLVFSVWMKTNSDLPGNNFEQMHSKEKKVEASSNKQDHVHVTTH